MTARLGGLKNVIKAVYGEDFGNISPDRLKLYKIPIGDDAELQEILGALGSGQLLQGNEFLEKVFDDVPFSQMPRVVVEPLDESK